MSIQQRAKDLQLCNLSAQEAMAQAIDEADTTIKELREALQGFHPFNIGVGQSLSYDALSDAWQKARLTLNKVRP